MSHLWPVGLADWDSYHSEPLEQPSCTDAAAASEPLGRRWSVPCIHRVVQGGVSVDLRDAGPGRLRWHLERLVARGSAATSSVSADDRARPVGHDCLMDRSAGDGPTSAGNTPGPKGTASERADRALRALGIPAALVAAVPPMGPEVEALLVYGSQARGDAVDGSDLDLLALVPANRPTIQSGDVSVSFYTTEQLATGVGTLFGAHLHRDARILWDDLGRLGGAVRAMGTVDTERLLHRAHGMSELFTSLDYDLPRYLPGLLREARYLLRSCLYAKAIQAGEACFSVRELAIRHDDPRLAELLASRQQGDPTVTELMECLDRLREIVGEFPRSRHGSLEATIVNTWREPGDVLSMAFMALGLSGDAQDYAEVAKILL